MKPTIFTKRFIVCPHCEAEEESGLCADHLNDGTLHSWGPWGCHSCGKQIKGTISADGSLDIEMVEGEGTQNAWDLLVLPPHRDPVFFILKKKHHPEYGDHRHLKFFYESHSCTTNWINDIVKVIVDLDDDKHGLLKFVRSANMDVMVDEAVIATGDDSVDEDSINPFYVFPELEAPWADLEAKLDPVRIVVDPNQPVNDDSKSNEDEQ